MIPISEGEEKARFPMGRSMSVPIMPTVRDSSLPLAAVPRVTQTQKVLRARGERNTDRVRVRDIVFDMHTLCLATLGMTPPCRWCHQVRRHSSMTLNQYFNNIASPAAAAHDQPQDAEEEADDGVWF